jgi:hypothetical protein
LVRFAASLDAGGVQPGVGFGNGKARLVLAAHQRRQHARALLIIAMHHDGVRAKQVDMDRRCRGEPATRCHPFHHQRCLGHAKPCPAIGLGHCDAQPAGICHGTVKRIGKCAIAVAATPIIIAEARANAAYAVDKVLMLLFDITTHETIRLGETRRTLQPELAGVDTNQG